MARADLLLLQRGMAPTRSAAQRLIERGAVERSAPAGWVRLRKTGEDLADGIELRITDDAELRWVSRAGLKLDGALAHCKLDVAGSVALDVGQSTGGFTEVLLARGVKHVVGVDVGNGQLHHTLRAHPQVTVIEGMNARALTRGALGDAMPAAGFDVVVADLSFIPLTTVLPALVPLLTTSGTLLALVKPQFELQPKDIGKGGLVKSGASYAEVERKLRTVCADLQLDVIDWFDSAITGGDGNREFFIRAEPRRPE
jgi:23S rRNA (cytidine1920-2'-O)/16S rRNA (cytidine1409-2'-O)-methyltransferase